jgi:D-tyrosyl-tRNA(Tyr) deacylase
MNIDSIYERAHGAWAGLDLLQAFGSPQGGMLVISGLTGNEPLETIATRVVGAPDWTSALAVATEALNAARVCRTDAARAESIASAALDAAHHGNVQSAARLAEEAASIERRWGDALVWSPLATVLAEALHETLTERVLS